MNTNLPVDDIDGLCPFLFHDPMFDNSGIVPDDGGVMQIYVCSPMPLYEFINNTSFQIGLKDINTIFG